MESIKSTTARIDQMLAKNSSDIDKSINNFKNTSSNLSKISDSLSTIEYNQMFAKVDETIENLNVISNKLKNGEGSLGKLIKDDSLYRNLDSASKELELLFQDIKENPKRYVHFSIFGKKNKPYQQD